MKKAKKNITLDDLAGMVAEGFNNNQEQLIGLQNGQQQTNRRLSTLEEGQEQIKLRLDNVAYRFELVELQRRVILLERRAGIKR